jgi:hypothetical protein
MYIETENFEESLRQKIIEISAMDRVELQRRAAIIHERIVSNYSWREQARRIVEFLNKLTGRPSGPGISGIETGGRTQQRASLKSTN